MQHSPARGCVRRTFNVPLSSGRLSRCAKVAHRSLRVYAKRSKITNILRSPTWNKAKKSIDDAHIHCSQADSRCFNWLCASNETSSSARRECISKKKYEKIKAERVYCCAPFSSMIHQRIREQCNKSAGEMLFHKTSMMLFFPTTRELLHFIFGFRGERDMLPDGCKWDERAGAI